MIDLDSLDLQSLQRFIERCENELMRRKSTLSAKDAELALQAQLAAHRRRKEQEKKEIQDIFRRTRYI